ncbi:insulin-like growth factor I, adult form [Daphnia carinata]|uniref:insulin-like growth factor I, adult form n=1 Tax=Daphnia carinata TaxID=120202 RepID=UPI0025795268|nr:insulin-like growth factor I, adult form [Daphnia carinata]
MLFRKIVILWMAVSHYGSSLSIPNNSIPKHYCGSSLSGALFSVCRENGFVTHFTPRTEFNRTTRGIIEECCINPCSEDQLSQYCQKKIARISIPIKRKRSQKFVDTNKVTKSKRSPTSACTCGNRIHSARSSKNKRKNRKRSTKARQTKDQSLRPSIDKAPMVTSTTESPSIVEAQYIDDWTWSGDEEGLFSVKSH